MGFLMEDGGLFPEGALRRDGPYRAFRLAEELGKLFGRVRADLSAETASNSCRRGEPSFRSPTFKNCLVKG
jgi:hypothetical protein